MTELTDLQLCKRIAEIDGIDLRFFITSTMDDGTFYTRADNGATRNINYLTDWRVLGPLMVKHKTFPSVLNSTSYRVYNKRCRGHAFSDDELPRIILECIVEMSR